MFLWVYFPNVVDRKMENKKKERDDERDPSGVK